MEFHTWLTYASAVLLLMAAPGPSQLLMLSNTLGHGFKNSRLTAFGDLTANALQMVVASAGLASILYASKYTFLFVKWFGIAYLLIMGARKILAGRRHFAAGQGVRTKSRSKLYSEGFLTSASNPKAVIFFAALFPQFINPNESVLFQLLVLGTTYLLLDGLFLTAYGVFSDWIATRFKDRLLSSLDRVSGVCLIVAAFLLGLKKVES